MATQPLNFRESKPCKALPVEMDDMSRVREYLKSQGVLEEYLDEYFLGYEVITDAKLKLGIN